MEHLISKDVKTELIQIRVSKSDKEKIKKVADERYGISDFILNAALNAVKQENGK